MGRKYDFTYDNANRLAGAAYMDNKNVSWGTTLMDFSVSGLTYDANGNILAMNQNGFKVGAPTGPIDQLSYTYLNSGASNKLQQVTDAANDTTTKLGDFHYNPATKQATDYSYDGNGNLLTDNNKVIDKIIYNYLNLPQNVHMNGKGNIIYTYDAAGNKLQKVTLDSISMRSTQTTYLDGFVYQQTSAIGTPGGGTDTLQFMGHEEGRARWVFHKYVNGSSAYGWEYDFFEKDHLGNTRMLLSQEKDTAKYLASMEAAYRNTENALFYNIPGSSYPRASAPGYPIDLTVTNPNDSVIRVNGSGQKVGPALILKVMSGDKVDIGANYYFNNVGAPNGQSLSASDIINSIASGIVSLTGGAHGSVATLTGGSSPLNGALGSYFASNNPTTTGKPNAYLNWILLDDQFAYVGTGGQSGALQVANYGTASGGVLQPPLSQTGIQIKTSGYLYIYVSNATPGWDVFFDNLSVTTYAGPMLEENHYYPFGLTIAGISDKALKSQYAQNKYRYNGKELQNQEFSDGTGLEQYDYGKRFQDPQLGRWWVLDPMADSMRRFSPYAYGYNNPMRFVDFDGMWPFPVQIRSFAPFKQFGGWFSGDNRGYSTSSSATSRVAQSFTVDPAKGSVTGLQTFSSPSSHPIFGTATATDDRGSITNLKSTDNKDGSTTTSFTASMAGHNPLVPGSADIDVHTNFSLTENDKNGTLNVNAVQTGDAFPAAETFIGDTKGNQLFIGVSPADAGTTGPYTQLPGDNNRPMMTANFTVTMDSNGVFTGVKQGDKTYSIGDWNKMNQNQPTAPK